MQEDTSTGIEGVTANMFNIQDNEVILNEAQQVEVYTVQSVQVYKGFTNRVTLQDGGIYIVRIAGVAAKVAIK